jgi:hypothetical protein
MIYMIKIQLVFDTSRRGVRRPHMLNYSLALIGVTVLVRVVWWGLGGGRLVGRTKTVTLYSACQY